MRSYEWYLLEDAERRAMLAEHGKMARDYPDVRANTVASFALGDYEWILAFEADELHRIVDLMRHLRGSETRRHVREEVPFYTGRRVAASPTWSTGCPEQLSDDVADWPSPAPHSRDLCRGIVAPRRTCAAERLRAVWVQSCRPAPDLRRPADLVAGGNLDRVGSANSADEADRLPPLAVTSAYDRGPRPRPLARAPRPGDRDLGPAAGTSTSATLPQRPPLHLRAAADRTGLGRYHLRTDRLG